jgi:ribosomal protein S12 methylthiotransferase
MAEAESLVSRGARELILIGQDITSYGRDRTDGIDLVGVVHELSGIVDLLWLRLMYAQPDGITDELLEAMSTEPKVVRYLDMPLQHSSREVLRRMGRRGDGVTYLSLIERIRHAMPDVFLRTTLISGFPGETRADARALESFVRDAAFDYVGVFPFSPEEGTVAAGLGDQIPLRTRRARAQRIRDTADSVGVERCAALVGATLEVLIEGYDEEEDAIIGRHRGQAPDVDGIVTLDRGERGSVVKARIIDSLGYDLEAEVL